MFTNRYSFFNFLVNKKFIFYYIKMDTLQKVQISSVVSRNTNGKSSKEHASLQGIESHAQSSKQWS